ncbi:MAG: nuclear transport factor 2 family protein [Candidatus Nanopelagicales bacterium]
MAEFTELDLQRIEVAKKLFAAWSSGNADAPAEFLAAEATLWDSIGGQKDGWSNIRDYFAHGLQRYPDLVLEPTGEYWARPDGIALQWVMSATVMDDSKGAEHKGKKWIVEGLSFLQFDGLTVVLEADYHEGTSREKSLHEGGLHAPIRR